MLKTDDALDVPATKHLEPADVRHLRDFPFRTGLPCPSKPLRME
jgi:hypothetical protein